MANFVHENDPNYNFKGWRLHFNTYTYRGKRNLAYLSLFIWGGVFYAAFGRKNKK
ncbi:hypothetical protein A3Q56_02630 [Intoshia linei]|uniref:Uncharacterized protein n=1 Tax=Intoshia linei TaxID=1819745 RepID=A0A177B7E6_9BILA|nr:hypothetical protein A3Q56_02630 [Intoshia linei]